MRLISLILALIILAGIIIYAKDSFTSKQPEANKTVKQQTQKLLEDTQKAVDELNKSLHEQQRKMDELNQSE